MEKLFKSFLKRKIPTPQEAPLTNAILDLEDFTMDIFVQNTWKIIQIKHVLNFLI
jgi:hypothetical protein